jgi:hypothetical protein
MLKCHEFDTILKQLLELKLLGEIEFVYPTSVKVAPFKDREDGTYVGILKVDYNNNPRSRLFKVVFNWKPYERTSDILAYMRKCLLDYDLM